MRLDWPGRYGELIVTHLLRAEEPSGQEDEGGGGQPGGVAAAPE
jgi:hypothetical protein